MNNRVVPEVPDIEKPRKIEVINEWLWHTVTIVYSTVTCCCCCGCCGNYSPKVLYG